MPTRRFATSGRRYRRALLDGLRFLDLNGLATIGFHTPQLDEVYVDVSLAYGMSGQGVLEPSGDPAARQAISDLLDRREPTVLAIVGGPGSGKTTMLWHTARRICQNRPGRRRRFVPMVLYLRDHVEAIVSSQAAALSRMACAALGDAVSAAWVERRLRAGDCVVMLDGLDEVARQADRERVATWVERQIARYPGNDYVVTSRPHGYFATPIAGATLLQVRGFTDQQVADFVRGWYLAVERHSAGTGARERAEAAAADLLDRIDRAPGLRDLTGNPLLLTMISNAHRYRGALPGSRARLYGEICQTVLWRRHEAKKLPLHLGGAEKEVLLRRLASEMMIGRVRDLPRAEVVALLEPVMRRFSTAMTVPDFLTDVGSNGLLVERENGRYAFAHHTFQEYLASAHLRDQGHPGILAAVVDDVWWRETTLLYAARAVDLDPIVRACLESGGVTALSLAFDCVEQGCRLAPELRERLDDLLGSAFAPDAGSDLRRLLAAVLTTRHFRHQIATGEGGRVCAGPVPQGLYWLYLRDTGGPPPDGPPSLQPTPERGRDRPVAGVRGADALSFVRWTNGLPGGKPEYRLPSRAELEAPAVRRKGVAWSVWVAGPSSPVLWTPPGVSHPHRIDAATLIRHVHDDIARSTPTLIRLLLLRAIVTIRVLARGLNLVQVPARDLALAQVLDYAFDLRRTVDHVSRLDGSFPLGGVRTAIGDLEQALNENQASNAPCARTPGLAAALARELDRLLPGSAEPLDLVLGADCRPAIDGALTHGRSFSGALEQVMGSALSFALSRVLRHDTSSARWPAEFARELVGKAAITAPAFTPSPDLLPEQLRRAGRELLNLRAPASPWLGQVAGGLAQAADVFERRCVPPATATAVRLAVLCLAAEAGGGLNQTFHEVAAGVTLLERRATGQAPPTETIILATG